MIKHPPPDDLDHAVTELVKLAVPLKGDMILEIPRPELSEALPDSDGGTEPAPAAVEKTDRVVAVTVPGAPSCLDPAGVQFGDSAPQGGETEHVDPGHGRGILTE